MGKRGFRSIAEVIAQTRALQESGNLTPEQMAEADAFCAQFGGLAKEEIAAYDFFFEHMPEDDSDITLVLLKAHLLIEHRTREFVDRRLPASEALSGARLSSHQLIAIAEAMCLPNPDPQWLWAMVRRVNSLRNKFAHNLSTPELVAKVVAFEADYRKRYPIQSGLVGCLGHLYAQVAALGRIASTPPFRMPGGTGRAT